MKRGFNLVLGLVLTMFLINFISALTTSSFSIGTLDICGNPNKVIMKMSSSTNAHGEIYSSSNYNIFLCGPVANEQTCDYYCSGNSQECEEISDKNTCEALLCNWKARNKIIGLSSSTNAHAEGPSQYNYDVDVCYGDLRCVSASEECPSIYPIEIISLSSSTNAHIGSFVDYPIKVCCKEGGIIEPFCGDSICNGDEICGDTDTSPECHKDCDSCPVPRVIGQMHFIKHMNKE